MTWQLSYLHEPGVLHNLATWYELNEIYVRYLRFLLPFIVCWCTKVDFESNKRKLQIVCLYCFLHYISQTYIGNILIAVNPFWRLPHLYDTYIMEQYKGAAFGELSPHVFAVADVAYRYLTYFLRYVCLFFCFLMLLLLLVLTLNRAMTMRERATQFLLVERVVLVRPRQQRFLCDILQTLGVDLE